MKPTYEELEEQLAAQQKVNRQLAELVDKLYARLSKLTHERETAIEKRSRSA